MLKSANQILNIGKVYQCTFKSFMMDYDYKNIAILDSNIGILSKIGDLFSGDIIVYLENYKSVGKDYPMIKILKEDIIGWVPFLFFLEFEEM